MFDGTTRLHKGDTRIHHFGKTACFAEYSVMPEAAVVPIETPIGMDIAALIGCYVYFALSELIGFLLVSPVFLFVLMYFLGVRPWTTAAASGAILTVIVYGLFRMLGIAMTQGILPF